uniref:WGS project CAEQ00000000 data, annotated contig 977 n=1 Tax=Trypanosoma congolense (strain IL3000) TaxID=1068625 RepID=F9WK23_TRYCI|nr:unnamed protein product [Trypanosoma congolense IL3000]
MPDSQTILRDWANGCLDDLESLDDLRGGQLSSRFHGFSQEARSGVLLSRLLFYLALPRYQNTAAASKNPVTQRETSRRTNYVEQRRRLLARERVQLDAPFPTYADCFGDMLSLAPVSRMTILLQFAKELISSAGQVGDELVQKHLSRIYDLTLKSIEFTPSPPVSQVDLHEVVDAHALACGDKGAVLTLIALLYVRFSHPFNHKAKQSAMVEREAMLFLLSKGTYKLSQDQNTGESSAAPGEDNNSEENEPEDDGKTLARQFLTQLEDDEQSPWQLFLKHCQPLINTMAHPYILRGNFWPSTAFDSPGLAYMLGSLGLALQRSLQEHRWHIILSCLVPIRTYSGLSRGMFTGGRGSSAALQVGLDRTGDWVFPDELSCIKSALQSREEAIRTAIKEGVLKCKGGWSEEEWQKMGYFVAKDKEKLLKSFETCSFDLMQLFLRRARLSHSCAMPVIDIGNWRLLLADINIVTPDKPDASLLDMSHVTDIFFRVMSSLAETDAAVKEPDSRDENYSSMPLPHYSEEMYYPEFIAALVLLVHDMYPAVYTSEDDKDKEPTITWIGDALTDFNFRQIVPPQTSESMVRPANAMAAIRGNAQAEEVLLRHNKVLQAIHTTYSKDVFGVVGMEKEQVVQMLRDSALTSHEISSSVVSEVFKACCVSKKVEDLCSEGKRREQDARPRDVATIRRRGNVSIVDPSVEGTSASRTKEISVLLYDGFLEFLCVICHFQLPNPLIPFDRRLERFLCRSVFRPLAHRSEAVAAVVSQHMHQLGPRAAEP